MPNASLIGFVLISDLKSRSTADNSCERSYGDLGKRFGDLFEILLALVGGDGLLRLRAAFRTAGGGGAEVVSAGGAAEWVAPAREDLAAHGKCEKKEQEWDEKPERSGEGPVVEDKDAAWKRGTEASTGARRTGPAHEVVLELESVPRRPAADL